MWRETKVSILLMKTVNKKQDPVQRWVSVKHCLLITWKFSFALLTGHTFPPEFPTRSTFRRCVTRDKGFLFIYNPLFLFNQHPQGNWNPCAWPACQCPIMGTPPNSPLYRSMVWPTCLGSHSNHVPTWSWKVFPVLLIMLSTSGHSSLSAFEGLTLNSVLNNNLLTNTLIVEHCDRLRFRDCCW